MKKRYINLIIIVVSSLFFAFFIMYRELIFKTVGYSLDIWINSILPSLFPFFVVSDILTHYNVIKYIPHSIRNFLSNFFNIGDNGIFVFLISILSGFPSNARIIKNLYLEHKLSKKEAEHLLFFSHFSNPMFILGTLSCIFFNNKDLGMLILISHYLPNFLIGFFLRKYSFITDYTSYCNDSLNFGLVFANSIKKSIDSLLMILGILTSFLIISTVIINLFNFDYRTSLLIKSLLEITSGLKALSLLTISNKFLVIGSSAILSFGGLSVHMQVINEISDTDISYKNFFIGRVFQMILSIIISYIICLFAF